jgi:hypothetical protein
MFLHLLIYLLFIGAVIKQKNNSEKYLRLSARTYDKTGTIDDIYGKRSIDNITMILLNMTYHLDKTWIRVYHLISVKLSLPAGLEGFSTSKLELAFA